MDQCTHEVRAEYWKRIIKDHPSLRAASRRAVSQKLDGMNARKLMTAS